MSSTPIHRPTLFLAHCLWLGRPPLFTAAAACVDELDRLADPIASAPWLRPRLRRPQLPTLLPELESPAGDRPDLALKLWCLLLERAFSR